MMDNDNSLNKRPTFKRALRNISMTSIFITMMLIWLLLSVTSVLTPAPQARDFQEEVAKLIDVTTCIG
ncbi:hypothetical protein ACUN9W_31825, partial [Escherichia coli]